MSVPNAESITEWPRSRVLELTTLGRRHGLTEARLLAGTGLRATDLSDPEARISREHEFAVIRNLVASVPPATPLPLEAGLDFHLWSFPYWGQAVRTAGVVGEALAFSVQFVQSLPVSAGLNPIFDGDVVRLRFENEFLPPDVRPFVTVRQMVFTAMTARELLGGPMPLRSVSGNFAKLPYAIALERFCGTAISWDAPHAEAVFDAAWLAHPLGNDPVAHARAVEQCWRMRREYESRSSVAARVRAVLERIGPAGATVGGVAAELTMSERSLRRRLAAEGTSFRQVLSQVRQSMADELFADGLSVEETATRLGYAEPTAFSHAFKRWTGVSPEAWRRQSIGSSFRSGG